MTTQFIWAHLYDRDGNWIAQFRDIGVAVMWVVEQGKDPNDFEIKMEPNRYPSA